MSYAVFTSTLLSCTIIRKLGRQSGDIAQTRIWHGRSALLGFANWGN